MKIGKPKDKGKKVRHKIVDGDNVFRILPPMGDLADKGVWFKYYSVVWGDKDSRGIMRPYLDCRVTNHKTKMVEVESAAYLRTQQIIARKDELVALFKAKKASSDDVKAAVDQVKRYNIEGKYYFNAISLSGEIGLLKLGTRGKNAIIACRDKARKNNQGDPIGIDGMFINITRSCVTGKALDTAYSAAPYTENVQGTINGQLVAVPQIKYHTITDDIIDRLEDEAFELDKLYPALTPQQIERIVNEGVTAIDEIFKVGDAVEADMIEDLDIEDGEDNSADTVPGINFAARTTVAAPVTQPVTPVTPVAVAPVVEQPKLAPAPAAPEVKPVADPVISDDDFLASIGAL